MLTGIKPFTTAGKQAKKSIMVIVDILIRVHPDLLAEKWAKVEEALSSSEGVVSAHFSP